MQEKKEETYVVNGNEIVLLNTSHNITPMGRCCHKWNGTYKIIKSTLPVSREDIESLKRLNVFGAGQIVNANTLNDEMHYSGIIDSGD